MPSRRLRTRSWSVVKAADPGVAIVRLDLRGRWWAPFRPRFGMEALTPHGTEWLPVLEHVLYDHPLFDRSTGRELRPPHTRDGERIEAALDEVAGPGRALAWYRGDPPPAGGGGPSGPGGEAGGDGDGDGGGGSGDAPGPRPAIPREWLRHPVAPEELGLLGEGLLAPLLARLRPGDTLWEFESPPETWKALHGRAGYALVREGVAVDAVITRLN